VARRHHREHASRIGSRNLLGGWPLHD
jgi:hypothetical protein